MLAVLVGLLTLVPGAAAAGAETLELTVANPAVGVVRLTATDAMAEPYLGQIEFQVEGQEPVLVPLATMAVQGEPDFGQVASYWTFDVPPTTAILDVPGLDPTGTYRVSARFVPLEGGPTGSASAASTATLSVTRTPFEFSATAQGKWARFEMGVLAYPTGRTVGHITIFDLHGGVKTKIAYDITAYGRVAGGYSIKYPSRFSGVHRFRAVFKPLPELDGIVDPGVVTTGKVRFPR